jgi:uncharacterized membrane protein
MLSKIRTFFVKGALLIIPIVVTVVATLFIINFISQFVRPIAVGVSSQFGVSNIPSFVLELITLAIFVLFTVLLGFIATLAPTEGKLKDIFNRIIESVPVVGNVYNSVRQMGETIAGSESAFNEVKLVEHPVNGAYSPAFVTSETPELITQSLESDEKVYTVFLPMGPNPVMGGHVIYVPQSNVKDIDISVEEGIQAIMTSGVTLTETEEAKTLSEDFRELREQIT